jgi:ABC-type cobalamin/Fe3+-siderophores transport system ATPase subunit
MSMNMLQVRGLTTGYGKKEIVHGIDFVVNAGEFVCIIGANGCGKTTALRSVLGFLPPFAGAVLINGNDAVNLTNKQRARHFAYIPQLHIPPFPFKVADVVLLGRTPHLTSTVAAVSKYDKIVAYEAMRQLSIDELAEREYTELSGGQQQLVLIARALAQEPDILVMDEPTASLDFGNQQLVLTRMHVLSRAGMAVLMVTHDPDHALFCADRVIVMEEGRIIKEGTPPETITSETMQRIYGTRVYVANVPIAGDRTVQTCVPLMGTGGDRA